MNKPTKRTPSLPSKADILAFIGKQPGKVGTREIARAFGLKNAMRAELKRMLRELASEGTVEKRGKKLHHPGTLPSTVLADVTARVSDGDLIAKFTQHALEFGAHGILEAEGTGDFAGADFAGLFADEGENVSLGGEGGCSFGLFVQNRFSCAQLNGARCKECND